MALVGFDMSLQKKRFWLFPLRFSLGWSLNQVLYLTLFLVLEKDFSVQVQASVPVYLLQILRPDYHHRWLLRDCCLKTW